MIIGKSQFPNTLEKVPIVSFRLALGKEVNSLRDVFFRVEQSDKDTETYLELGDIQAVPEYTGELAYADVREGYKMTIQAKEYLLGLKIEYRWLRTDQLRVARDLPRMLGLAMRRRIAAASLSWFNNMFNVARPTKDALALCSSAHTSAVGGATQSNRVALIYSAANLEAVRITMRKFLSNKDNPLEIAPNMIVGGVDLDGPFQETIESSGKVDVDINNMNIHKGKYTAVTDVRIQDPANWCVIDKSLMKEYNIWNEVDKPDIKKAEDFDGRTMKYLIASFFGEGSTDWPWILGSEVS